MKSKIILFITILSVAVLFNACKKESTTEPGDTSSGSYFPNANGNYYRYSMERTDSNGTKTTGTRSSSYQGTQIFGGVSYQAQVDSVTILGQTITESSFFRKSDTGVFYFLDTTGIAAAIPDSLLQYIQLDAELRLFSFPLSDGKTWPVFKMNLAYGFLTVTLAEVTGYYQGKENVTLNLNSGSVSKEAAKIKYILKLQIPAPTPTNPLNFLSQQFDAFLWVVADVGIAKMQGNGTILGAFAGQGVDFDDTTTVISQTLTGYSLK